MGGGEKSMVFVPVFYHLLVARPLVCIEVSPSLEYQSNLYS